MRRLCFTRRLTIAGSATLFIGVAVLWIVWSVRARAPESIPAPTPAAVVPPDLAESRSRAVTTIDVETASRGVADRFLAVEERLLASDVPDIPFILSHLIESGGNTDLMHALLIRWSSVEPRRAIQWTERLGSAALRSSLMCIVACEWVQRDLDSARQWLAQADPANRDEITVAMAYSIVGDAPKGSVDLALQLSPGGQQPALLGQVVAEWAMHDPTAAARWTGDLPPGELRDHVIGALATLFAEEDGAGAAELTLQLLSPGPRQTTVIGAVIQRWARTEPVLAAKWIERLPAGPLQSAALDTLVSTWAIRAPEAAERWLVSLQGTPVFTIAAESVNRQRAN